MKHQFDTYYNIQIKKEEGNKNMISISINHSLINHLFYTRTLEILICLKKSPKLGFLYSDFFKLLGELPLPSSEVLVNPSKDSWSTSSFAFCLESLVTPLVKELICPAIKDWLIMTVANGSTVKGAGPTLDKEDFFRDEDIESLKEKGPRKIIFYSLLRSPPSSKNKFKVIETSACAFKGHTC